MLAAGKGERMESWGSKVLEPILGRPMLDWILSQLPELGIGSVWVVVGHRGDHVRNYLKSRKGIRCVRQKRQLGTADAVRAVLPYLAKFDEIFVICGDTPLFRTESLARLIREHRREVNIATFLSAQVPDPSGYGRVIRKEGRASAIVEERDCSGAERQIREINAGVYCFNRRALQQELAELTPSSNGEFYLTDLFKRWSERSLQVNAVKLADENEGWGVNSFEELIRAAGILKNRMLDRCRRHGVVVIDPATTYVGRETSIGKGTILYPFTVIEPEVAIGEGCRIGPFAHIRSGSRIDSGAEIGNFVEVNRTRVGVKSRAKHLSYLGDARIGAGVNIGAGTITANYNGKEKHRTVIDDGAMIGSHTTLIAPVRVGQRAVTGAGSVVLKRKNVPAGRVVVGVPARILNNHESY